MEKINRIAMLSTHGYFDPVPKLGRTDTGGQVVYVLELSKALSKFGIKVDIYTRWFDKTQKQIDPVPGYPDVNVIRIEAGAWEFIAKEKIYDVLPELTDNMEKFIKTQNINYDLFHGHYVDAGIVGLEVAKRFNKPFYFTAHSLGAWKRQQMGGDPDKMEEQFNFKHRIAEENRIFKQVNAHTFTTELQNEKYEELYEVKKDNIAIIPPGVDIERYHPVSESDKKAHADLPDKYIYCLSRIDTNKGHDLLIEAFSHVYKATNDVYLIIGGGSPNPKEREKDLLKRIENMITANNMQDRVIMLGYVPDDKMAMYYQHAQFFVLPSLFEPFGMTSQEAMGCGVPVVASKYGGIKNVIDHGKTGLLIDPKNDKEFGDTMLELLQNEKRRHSIGTNARKLVKEQYSWKAIAEAYLDFWEKYS